MRQIVLLLVLANLVLFAWQLPLVQERLYPEQAQTLPDGVQRLRLLSEIQPPDQPYADRTQAMNDDNLATGERATGASAPETEAETQALISQPITPPQGFETARAYAQQRPAETSEETASGSVIALEPESIISLDAEPTTAEVVAVETGREDRDTSASPTEKVVELVPEPKIGCYVIGPFGKLVDVESVVQYLPPEITDTNLRQEIKQEQIGYWVLIPAQKTRNQARKKVQELRQAGIDDVWRFTKGRLANAISLGLFSQRGPAERRKREIDGKGFETQVQPRFREKTLYWLDFKSPEEAMKASENLDNLYQVYTGVKLTGNDCPVAP